MSNPKLSVIIVNYNTRAKISDCLNSVFGEINKISGEVIVVDNASKDGSVEFIKDNFPEVVLVVNSQNLGFAHANNQAAKVAKGNLLFFLNPDTKVLTGCLTVLLSVAEKFKDAAVLAPKILNPDGTNQNSVRNLPTVEKAILEYFFAREGTFSGFSPNTKKPFEVEAVVGAGMLVPKSIFANLGRFDERYFLYYEDLDFCRKAREMGYKIIFVPQARIIHEIGAAGRGEGAKTHAYLKDSSRIYHGALVSFLINFILFWGQKWQRLFAKI